MAKIGERGTARPLLEGPEEKRRPRREDQIILQKKKSRKGLIPFGKMKRATRMIIEHWNIQDQLVTHKLTSKTVERAGFILERDILPDYSVERVMDAIENLNELCQLRAEARFAPGRLNINDFFEDSHGKFFRKSHKEWIWFFKCVDGKHVEFLKLTDMHPEITDAIREKYFDLVTGRRVKLSFIEEKKLRIAAIKVKKSMDSQDLSSIMGADLDDYVVHLFIALTMEYDEQASNITPGHLCSTHTWENIWPRYLKRNFE